MTLRRLILAPAVLAALVVPTASRSVDDTSDLKLFPIKQGSTWTYAGKFGEDVKIKMRATMKTVWRKGDKLTAKEEWVINGAPSQVETYVLDRSGLVRTANTLAGTAMRLQPPVPIMKFPMKAGATWTYKGAIIPLSPKASVKRIPATATVKVSGPEKITTPAGEYEAWRVDMNLTLEVNGGFLPVPNTCWFAPNVGLVRQRAEMAGPDGKPVVMDGLLTQYAPGK